MKSFVKAISLKKLSFILASALTLIVLIKMNGNLVSFFNHIKSEDAVYVFSQVMRSDQEKRELLNEIKKQAPLRAIPAINAKIDRIYKAIPGYNGLEVDVDATYELNVNRVRGAELSYIYRQVEPVIQIEDLGDYPIYMGNPEKKSVGIMINVAWGNEYLDSILTTLNSYNARATFFLDGSWLKKNKEIALRLLEEGHELSNHAYSHPNMSSLSKSEQLQQIVKTETLLKELNVHNKWFAPPSGDFNQTTVQVARDEGLMTVLWTVDTIDWKKPSVDIIMNRIQRDLVPGALILMHPTQSTVDALPHMLEYIMQQGLVPTTVSGTLSSERSHDSVEGVDIF